MNSASLPARAAVLAAALLLAGCSGEPSVSNIREAMLNDPKARAGFEMLKGLNPNAPSSFEDAVAATLIEKGTCIASTDAPGFICDIRAGMTVNGAKQFGQWGKARFFKVNGTWNMEERR